MENTIAVKEDKLSEFIKSEREWLNSIIEQYPCQIPVKALSEHWGCQPDSIRAAIEQDSNFGVFWRKDGKTNKAYLIPTGFFVQWYCRVKF